MTLRVRVHVDEDGNVVIPIGKTLHDQQIELNVEILSEDASSRANKFGESDQDREWNEFEQATIDNRKGIWRFEPKKLTPEQRAAVAADFDQFTGAWIGDFVEPEDPPPEPEKLF
jgi:hypothetical protein